jgi:hypothetical protein
MKETLPCHSKCYKALFINWTPYQVVKTEQRCTQTQKRPDQVFRRKKPEAIYNADTRLPPREPRQVRLGLSSTDAHFVFCYLP